MRETKAASLATVGAPTPWVEAGLRPVWLRPIAVVAAVTAHATLAFCFLANLPPHSSPLDSIEVTIAPEGDAAEDQRAIPAPPAADVDPAAKQAPSTDMGERREDLGERPENMGERPENVGPSPSSASADEPPKPEPTALPDASATPSPSSETPAPTSIAELAPTFTPEEQPPKPEPTPSIGKSEVPAPVSSPSPMAVETPAPAQSSEPVLTSAKEDPTPKPEPTPSLGDGAPPAPASAPSPVVLQTPVPVQPAEPVLPSPSAVERPVPQAATKTKTPLQPDANARARAAAKSGKPEVARRSAAAAPPDQGRSDQAPQPAAKKGAVNGNPDAGAMSRATYAALLSAEIARHKAYPSAARAAGITGAVSVVVVVGPSGRIVSHSIVRSSGSAQSDGEVDAMMAAVQAPPPPNGSFRGRLTIRFNLD